MNGEKGRYGGKSSYGEKGSYGGKSSYGEKLYWIFAVTFSI
jgi:hypothetical protein